MKKGIILGIDTSNYTTSVGAVDTDGGLIANVKVPLPVKEGERGLRQSDAVFAHTKNIPIAMEELKKHIGTDVPVAVGVSKRPRNVDGSYMPCFLSGVAAASGISTTAHIPLYSFSHQCGHIMAAIYSSRRFDLLSKEFCAFHVSGGTTEMLYVSPVQDAFSAEIIGGTLDVNAGQLIDRVGVMMGLKFPAGPALEQLALENKKKIPKRKVSAKEFYLNLSGLENVAKKLYDDTADKALTAAFILNSVSDALIYLCDTYEASHGNGEFLFAGGVMSNSIIKNKISARFAASFAEPSLSSDNAVGVAMLALRAYTSENK